MTNRLRLAAAIALLLPSGLTLRAEEAKEQKKIRVLIIDGQNNHNWKATTPIMKKELEDSGRFTVEVATSPPSLTKAPVKPKDETDKEAVAKYKEELAKFKELEAVHKSAVGKFRPDLTKYDVVLSNYNGEPWAPEFQKDLEDSLKEGKIGLVIVHAANNSFGGWTEYNLMIGMGWRGNNAGDRLTLDSDGKEKRVPKGTGPGAGHGAGTRLQGRHPRQRASHHQGHAAGMDARPGRAVSRHARSDPERPPAGDGLLGQVEGRHRRARADDLDGELRQGPRLPHADGPRPNRRCAAGASSARCSAAPNGPPPAR